MLPAAARLEKGRKKGQRSLPAPFYILIADYLPFLAGALVDVFALALPLSTPAGFEKNITEMMHNPAITLIAPHVPFSITSDDCFTPITWELTAPNEPERPPPFGFWIRMKNASTTQAKMMSIVIIGIMILYPLKLLLFCGQSKCFFEDFANLIYGTSQLPYHIYPV